VLFGLFGYYGFVDLGVPFLNFKRDVNFANLFCFIMALRHSENAMRCVSDNVHDSTESPVVECVCPSYKIFASIALYFPSIRVRRGDNAN
jgi:hypothetical protein